MTTWPGFIPNADIDQDSPVTQPLMTSLRDGPLSIAEADSTVPDDLLPQVTLGTITTTSGSSQSLTSLDLTPFKTLKLFLNGVSVTATGNITLTGAATVYTSTSAAQSYYGKVEIDLSNGAGVSMVGSSGTNSGQVIPISSSITTATTTIQINAAGNFDAGSVTVLGCK